MNLFFGFLFIVVLPIAFVIFIGLFFQRNQLKNSTARNLVDALKDYKEHFRGTKGNVIYYGIYFLFALVLIIRFTNFFN